METIKCPYCAEKIAKEAKKCKHCLEFVAIEYINLTTNLKLLDINTPSTAIQLQSATLELLDRNLKMQEVLNPIMVQANKSTILTNENIKSSNKVLKIIFIITAIISLGGLFVSTFNTYREIHNDYLTSQLYIKDTQLQSMNATLTKIKIAETRHIEIIDSLKKTLYYRKYKK